MTQTRMKQHTTALCTLLFALAGPAFAAPPLTLTLDPAAAGPGQFAAAEIRREAAARGITITSANAPADAIRISLAIGVPAATNSGPQSYDIGVQRHNGRSTISVRGAGPAGVMYGGLDIAEAIRTGTLDTLKDSVHTPHIAQRGIKFNIPLDLRTPSYTDPSHAAQANIPEVWSMEFWREFLDDMARFHGRISALPAGS